MSTRTGPWRALAQLVEVERRRYGVLALALTASSALPLVGPLLVKLVVDRAADGQASMSDIVVPATIFLVLAIASQIIAVLVTWLATVTAWNTSNRLRLELAEHVLGLDLEFHRTHAPGELIQRVDGDITSVSDFLSRVVTKVVSALLLLVGMLIVLVVIDWRLGLGFLVYILLAGHVATRTKDRAVEGSVGEMTSYARLYGGIEERLTAGEDLRANRAGPHVMWRFIEESVDVLKAALELEKAFVSFWGRVQVALMLGVSLALVASAAFLESGVISTGTTLLLVQYAFLLRRPLEEVVDNFDVVQKATGAMVRVKELLDIQPVVLDNGRTSPPAGALSLECIRLGFHYGDGDPILADIDLSIAAGRSVGLVGRTGGGKSTLTRLVLRLADATEGELRLGGVDITDIPMHELRRRVAMVPQEVHLITGTVRDNVTLFDDSVSDERVADALRRVGLDALAEDLDGHLGGSDLSLSAGEEQLLSLARIWLRQPDLVVLDEATARVDPRTEERLEHAVAELIKGRTALIVAHRLSTLRAVDEIVVIDDGRMIEHGDRSMLAGDTDSEFRRLLDLALETTT